MDGTLATLGLGSSEGGSVAPERMSFVDDGSIPNTQLATLLFRSSGLEAGLGRESVAQYFARLFAAYGWPSSWRGGVFDYHHYHSTAHEAFGALSGWGKLRLGGEAGRDVEVNAGDALVLPAGTGHCCLEASDDFLLLAAYPADQPTLDLLRADPAEHDAAVARIAQLSKPEHDPLGGAMSRWWS